MLKQAMIGIKPELKEKLNSLKTHKRDSYGDVIVMLINHFEFPETIPKKGNPLVNSEFYSAKVNE